MDLNGMSHQLITIRTFWNEVEANIAASVLRRNGIEVYLSGGEIAAMNWSLTNAIGGIRLQVADHDVERSEKLLELAMADITGDEHPELDGRVPGEINDTDREQDGEEGESLDADPYVNYRASKFDEVLTSREQTANRALKVATVGILFAPLQIYTAMLVYEVYKSKEQMSPRHARYAWVAVVISAVYLTILVLFVVIIMISLLSPVMRYF
ncbi:MAG: hypothetical protein C0478_07140 [Planctomyces sp.]|nr:hypothetical protein [Planctomyces sp.]